MPAQTLIRLSRRFFLTGTLAAACTLPCCAQEAPVRSTTPVMGQVTAPATATAPKPATGTTVQPNEVRQGLTMHGHWTIDVKNPDGTVTAHRDFENALQTNGAAYLVALMAGYIVPSDFEIFLNNPSQAQTPCVSSVSGTSYQGCVIVRSLTSNPGSTSCMYYLCSANLSYTYNTSLSNISANSIVLSGTITANQSGTISSVATYASSCPINPVVPTTLSTTSPAACTAQTNQFGVNAITAAGITSVSVASGQIVQVTVTLSFS